MNRLVGVCITQNSGNPRISSTYKLYAFYYFYIVVLSVCVKKKIKCPNNKKEIYNDKYRHTRDRLFSLRSLQLTLRSPGLTTFSWDLSKFQILDFCNGETHQHFQKCLLDSSKQIATSIPEWCIYKSTYIITDSYDVFNCTRWRVYDYEVPV